MTLPPRQGFSKVSPIGVSHHLLRDDGKHSVAADCDTDVANHIAGGGVARRHPHPPKGSSDPRSPAMAPSSPHPPDGAARRAPTDPRPPAHQNARGGRRRGGPPRVL